jgi:hypothetical protein
VLRHEGATLAVTVLTLLATIWLYVVVPSGSGLDAAPREAQGM